MQTEIESRHLEEVVILVPPVFEDSRGFFMATLRLAQRLARPESERFRCAQPLTSSDVKEATTEAA